MATRSHSTILLLAALAALAGCAKPADKEPAAEAPPPERAESAPAETKLVLTSAVFKDGEPLPPRYTADRDNISPPLQWSGAPPATASFALVCDDPDAPKGTWVHWVLYAIPPDTGSLPEAVPPMKSLGNGASQGTNDFGKTGYGGPAPPPGAAHRYFFRLYALDFTPELEPGATKSELYIAIDGHVLDDAVIMGTYQRD